MLGKGTSRFSLEDWTSQSEHLGDRNSWTGSYDLDMAQKKSSERRSQSEIWISLCRIQTTILLLVTNYLVF